MTTKREKNNRHLGSVEEGRRNISIDEENKYTDEESHVTDTDAAEANPLIKRASQVSGNDMEEGNEDYDDEEEKDN